MGWCTTRNRFAAHRQLPPGSSGGRTPAGVDQARAMEPMVPHPGDGRVGGRRIVRLRRCHHHDWPFRWRRVGIHVRRQQRRAPAHVMPDSPGLMPTPPPRPVQRLRDGTHHLTDRRPQQAPDVTGAQPDRSPRRALNGVILHSRGHRRTGHRAAHLDATRHVPAAAERDRRWSHW